MKMSHDILACSIALVLLPMNAALTQSVTTRARFEFGTDVTLTKVLEGDHATSLQVPGQLLRVGYFILPNVSIETALGFQYAAIEGSSTSYTAAHLGVLINHNADSRRTQVYAHPYAALTSYHLSADAGRGEHFRRTVTNTGLGLGVGLRLPLSDRLASRIELQFEHLEAPTGLRGDKNLRLALGISYLTR